MPYVARRGAIGRCAIVCLGGLMTVLVGVGCSDDMPADPTGSGGSGGSDSGAGDGGKTDAGLTLPWKAVPVEGSLCRDGTNTGYGINVNPASRKLLIWLEGGGACFNELSCTQNPDSWAPTDANLAATLSYYWVMARSAENNPFRDWNLVFVPYCSGDVHSGSSMSGYKGQPQVGFLNFKRVLDQIVPQFPGLEQVVLGGISAGGFGVAWNWLWTQDAFGQVPVTALDDSGPPMGPDVLSPCQQQRSSVLWNWGPGLHPSCKTCDIATGNVVRPLLETTVKATTTRLGLLSYDEDGTIKNFFGYGIDNCAQWESSQLPIFPAGRYPSGLAELRTQWAPYPHVAMYVVPGGSHTFLSSDIVSVKTGTSIPMLEWIKRLINKSDGWSNVAP